MPDNRVHLHDGENTTPVLAQSGSFVTSGGGMSATEDGMIMVALGVVLGAIGGLMGGFVVSHLCRYVGYLFGRHIGGGRWVLIGGLLGATVLGLKAWLDSRE
jgi:hypothetical protein